MSEWKKRGHKSAEEMVWAALRAHANRAGEVSGTAAELREWLGAAAEDVDVHLALIRLKNDGRFRSQHFSGSASDFFFTGTLVQRGPQTPEAVVWAALRAHADSSGHVSGTEDELREWMGPDADGIDVHVTLIRLNQDGRFRSTPMFENSDEGFSFSVTLRQ